MEVLSTIWSVFAYVFEMYGSALSFPFSWDTNVFTVLFTPVWWISVTIVFALAVVVLPIAAFFFLVVITVKVVIYGLIFLVIGSVFNGVPLPGASKPIIAIDPVANAAAAKARNEAVNAKHRLAKEMIAKERAQRTMAPGEEVLEGSTSIEPVRRVRRDPTVLPLSSFQKE